MNQLLKKIKDKIIEEFSLREFADNQKIRQATLYDFLNGKKDITLSTFLKITKPLGFEVCETLPNKFIEVTACYIDGKSYVKGAKYNNKKILICFGTGATSHQGFLLEGNEIVIW